MQIPLLADFANFPTRADCEGFIRFAAQQCLATDCCDLATEAA
jgi:hypothetical protein